MIGTGTPIRRERDGMAHEAGHGMIGRVTEGDCVEAMRAVPSGTVDMVFADPPYNLRLGDDELTRPDHTSVRGVREDWDAFPSIAAYDDFTRAWLSEARRTLRPAGTIFAMGSYHNIYRIGAILQDLGFWILNDIVWIKENPMPNFRGTRFANAHETMIWAVRDQGARNYTFNYEILKAGNEDVQLRSDWVHPTCGGRERLRDGAGAAVHPTQKPLALVRRAMTAATRRGDLVLDPFLGSGTTAVVATEMGRRWIGIEGRADYAAAARERVAGTAELDEALVALPEPRRLARRVPFSAVVDSGLIRPGDVVTCPDQAKEAVVRPDGTLSFGRLVGSIHQMGAAALGRSGCNGWSYWHYLEDAARAPIDDLRKVLRGRLAA